LVFTGIGTTATGSLSISSGNASAGISGPVALSSGTGTTGSGTLLMSTGGSIIAGASGNITIQTGSAGSTGSNSGDISILTGASTGTKGSIIINGGKLSFFAVTAVVQQSVNTILVNNVTSGGTLSTIADFTSLTVYATDAGTIRNNFYRLTEKVLKLETALRNYGLAIN
jgi:hypothetical protein